MTNPHPALIIIGGYPGSGKTSIARHLAADLQLPRLSSDMIGETIRRSHGSAGATINAIWMAYDIVFDLCGEFMRSGVSTILDLNMGWRFQSERLDHLRAQHPTIRSVILMLRCPRAMCHARIQQRNALDPASDPAERFETEARFLELWQFLEQLDRPDMQSIDAAHPFEVVYEDVKGRL